MTRFARPTTPARTAAGVLLLGLIAPTPIPAQQAAEPQAPATTQTIADRFRTLKKVPAQDRDRQQRAELAGLEFCLLLGVGDGRHAAELIDAVGYQPLPLEGKLPLDPPRPIPRGRLADSVSRRPESNVDDVPAARFRLLTQTEAREHFPATAEWMLPKDQMLIIDPGGDSIRNWVRRKACLVIRDRGGEAIIVGGNLFEAFDAEH